MFHRSCPDRAEARGATGRNRRQTLSPISLLVGVLIAGITLAAAPAFGAPAPRAGAASAVIDYSNGFRSSTPARLKKAGVGVVIRYVGGSAWKSLTPAEAKALRAQGIDIAAVYESSAGWILGGRAAGVAAARAARRAIIAAGGPAQPFVYFACDTDTHNYAAVNAALVGAQSVLGPDNVGIYGSYSVCQNALKVQAATKAWQTVAWSNGRVLQGAALLQLVPQTLGNLGVNYDFNVRFADDVGQWGAHESNVTASPLSPAIATAVGPESVAVGFHQVSTPTTQTLRAIESSDGVSAWAVGDGGTILHTTSGGAVWSLESAPTSATLYAVHFASDADGWAAGANGTIFHTADGGLTWDGESTPTTATLRALAFSDAENGWAVGDGGAVLHTSNGGVNWTSQSVATTGTISSVDFSSGTRGMAFAENGAFLFTNDGGTTWFRTSLASSSTISAADVENPKVAWSVGTSGTVLHTADGGLNWTAQPTPTTSALADVAFSDTSTGIAVGASGTLLTTADAGRTWSRVPVAAAGSLHAIELGGNQGFAVGDHGAVYLVRVIR